MAETLLTVVIVTVAVVAVVAFYILIGRRLLGPIDGMVQELLARLRRH